MYLLFLPSYILNRLFLSLYPLRSSSLGFSNNFLLFIIIVFQSSLARNCCLCQISFFSNLSFLIYYFSLQFNYLFLVPLSCILCFSLLYSYRHRIRFLKRSETTLLLYSFFLISLTARFFFSSLKLYQFFSSFSYKIFFLIFGLLFLYSSATASLHFCIFYIVFCRSSLFIKLSHLMFSFLFIFLIISKNLRAKWLILANGMFNYSLKLCHCDILRNIEG